MAGLSDLLGKDSVIEQLLLWGVLNQVISSLSAPGLTALEQDANQAHPETALPASVAADALAKGHLSHGHAQAEAAKNGINAERFRVLAEAAKVRIPPADLAMAVLRSYLSETEAESQAKPQGIDAAQLRLLKDLAGDAPGPQQLAEALRRGLIERHGHGADSTSFDQGIAETRLHDKWAKMVAELSKVLLSPPDAASAVVRNFLPHGQAASIAEKSGVDRETFDILTHLSADAPGPQQLAEALRRGLIGDHGRGADSTSFEQGIAEGRLADKWAPVIQGLSRIWPTPVDALEAGLKGQLSTKDARETFIRLGGDPQFYDWLLASQGDAPSPLEAASMAARGIIPWHGRGPDATSFDQAIREGRTRNKWTEPIRELSRYLPPPGEIITFLAHRAISTDHATKLLAQHDMAPEILAAYLNEAELTALSEYRGLTQSAVVDMYYGHLIDRGQAVMLLEVLHVTDKAAELLLDYADLRQVIASVQKSVQRIAGLFVGRKISVATAREALHRLGIPTTSVADIIDTWELQAQANVKTLTESQLVDAFYYGIIEQDIAMTELQAIGYTAYDAWVLLSNKVKGPLPNQPERQVAAPPGAVIPGTT